jgi:hypothetical protein
MHPVERTAHSARFVAVRVSVPVGCRSPGALGGPRGGGWAAGGTHERWWRSVAEEARGRGAQAGRPHSTQLRTGADGVWHAGVSTLWPAAHRERSASVEDSIGLGYHRGMQPQER